MHKVAAARFKFTSSAGILKGVLKFSSMRVPRLVHSLVNVVPLALGFDGGSQVAFDGHNSGPLIQVASSTPDQTTAADPRRARLVARPGPRTSKIRRPTGILRHGHGASYAPIPLSDFPVGATLGATLSLRAE